MAGGTAWRGGGAFLLELGGRGWFLREVIGCSSGIQGFAVPHLALGDSVEHLRIANLVTWSDRESTDEGGLTPGGAR